MAPLIAVKVFVKMSTDTQTYCLKQFVRSQKQTPKSHSIGLFKSNGQICTQFASSGFIAISTNHDSSTQFWPDIPSLSMEQVKRYYGCLEGHFNIPL